MKNKYDDYYYWENIIKKDKSDNPFAGDPITEESLFFHGVIINCHGESYENWLHFPNIKALLGFLQYVFVPTAFYAFLSNDTVLLVQGNLDEMLDIMTDSEKFSKKELIPQMRKFSRQLRELWNYDSDKCIDKLKKFSVEYSDRWSSGDELFSYFNVFKSPIELGKYIVESYENSEEADITMFKDQLELSKAEWLSICDQVYENDFMKRKFTEILNNRLKDML